MIDSKMTLSQTQEEMLERRVDDLQLQLLDCIDQLLSELPNPEMRALVYETAFEGNDILPKRSSRPKIETALLVEQLSLAYDPAGTHLETLLEFTVAVTEYYDICDDVLDNDVSKDNFSDVFVVLQLLFPLFVRRLDRLGSEAATFWTDRAISLVAAPTTELSCEPSLEAYRSIVDQQVELFGFVTGLAAVVAGGDDSEIRTAERIGHVYYTYEQFLIDAEQYAQDDDDPWNLWALTDEADAIDHISEQRELAHELTAGLPKRRRETIRSLFAHDLDSWLQQESVDF